MDFAIQMTQFVQNRGNMTKEKFAMILATTAIIMLMISVVVVAFLNKPDGYSFNIENFIYRFIK